MLRWLVARVAWMAPSLLGITFLTFLMLDLAPVDRARLQVGASQEQGSVVDERERQQAVLRLQIRYGMIDPATHQPLPVLQRYGRWLRQAATLQLAGPDETEAAFWRSLREALGVTILLGACALAVALGIGIPLGAWLGRRAGAAAERRVSRLLFVLGGLPDLLVATLLAVAFGGVWLAWFPSGGLRTPPGEPAPASEWLDIAQHLVLPVAALSLAPLLLVVRFVREGVRRAAGSAWADNLRAWGADPRTLQSRLLRNGLAPLATLMGSLLPLLVTGSIVVESRFGLDGIGRMAWRAMFELDHARVMALVLLTSTATLVAFAVSDLLHRLVDPRVRLDA